MKVKSLSREGFEATFAAEPLDKTVGLGGVESGFAEPLIFFGSRELGATP